MEDCGLVGGRRPVADLQGDKKLGSVLFKTMDATDIGMLNARLRVGLHSRSGSGHGASIFLESPLASQLLASTQVKRRSLKSSVVLAAWARFTNTRYLAPASFGQH